MSCEELLNPENMAGPNVPNDDSTPKALLESEASEALGSGGGVDKGFLCQK